MLHIDVKNYGKFIVNTIPHYSFKTNLFRNHLTILLIEDIILLASHGANDMLFTLQYFLHESIDSWSDLLPISKAVTLQVGMVFQQVIPALRYGIYDNDFHTCIFTNPYGFHIGFGGVKLS